MPPRHTRHRLFTDRFRLDDRYLHRGNRRRGDPAIIGGERLDTGERIVIKEWVRNPSIVDEDLREIWRHEIRQLHRLGGFPGADEYIVSLQDSAEDATGFYLVLGCGQRRPLKTFLDSPTRPRWLDRRRLQGHRLQIWRNLERLAIGLDILHAQGLLHRNLDGWAVFTDGGDEADFQLSGFEWSVRLISAGAGIAPEGDSPRRLSGPLVIDSFANDWRAFGELASLLLEVDSKSLLKNRVSCPTAQHLLGAERGLLFDLLREDRLRHLDGNTVIAEIRAIVSTLAGMASRREAKLCLACEFGTNSRLSQAIVTASGDVIDRYDIEQQLSFVREDLAEAPQLVSMKGDDLNPGGRLLLVGQALNYRLRPFLPQGHTEPKWDLAFCQQVGPQRPSASAVEREATLSDTRIEVMPIGEGHRRFAALQGRTVRWPDKIPKESITGHHDPEIERFRRGMILTQILEALFTACDVWPVRLVDREESGGSVRVSVSSRPDTVREQLSAALQIDPPALRIAGALLDGQTATESDWKLSEIGSLGDRDYEEANWKFVGCTSDEATEPAFWFERTGAAPLGAELFLWHGEYVGHDSLLRRRLKALRTLGEHTELLAMLTNRRRGVRSSYETLVVDDTLMDLDESKRKVLEELWSVLPSYCVQGPPGVGKTRMVRELVARYFDEDSTARLLLSAQSHQALDHLLAETRKALGENHLESSLNIRCRPRDHHGPDGPFDIRRQSREILSGVVGSELAQAAPESLKARLNDLQATFEDPAHGGGGGTSS